VHIGKISPLRTLQPTAKRSQGYPFSFPLPDETPLTMRDQPVYLRTGLDISTAIDPKDTDYIQVRPHPLMQQVLNAIENLGFQLYKVDCEYNPHFGVSIHLFKSLSFDLLAITGGVWMSWKSFSHSSPISWKFS
jgi:sporulation-control protein